MGNGRDRSRQAPLVDGVCVAYHLAQLGVPESVLSTAGAPS
jgi:hypothetical protein